MASSRAPYSLVSAFTSNPFSGNPAAVLFLPDVTSAPVDYLAKIAANLNQPILSVVSSEPLSSNGFDHSIRFLTAGGKEIPLCGHGTLAASRIIFSSPKTLAAGTRVIHFKTIRGDNIISTLLEDDFIEIEIPDAPIRSATSEEQVKLKSYLDQAFGRDVLVKDIKIGSGNYPNYVMYEVDASEDLAGSKVNGKQLIENGFTVNSITTQSTDPDAIFASRMFAPSSLPEPYEDHVCGSMHALLVPHWFTKLGISSGQEVQAKQVSARGGKLRIVWEKERGRVRLRGQCAVLADGELHL